MVSVPPSGSPAGEGGLSRQASSLAERLAAELDELAVLVDFDGTLAPIVDDPAAAAPDVGAAAALARLVPAAARVACITGRPALLARDLLGVPAIAYSGLHGAQQLAPDAAEPSTPAVFTADGDRIAELLDRAMASAEGLAGLDVERKGPIVALHWRRAVDPHAAEARAEQLGAQARAAGLRTGAGRCVLELRPALEITKGDAARSLLAGSGAAHVLFAGDDLTDLDAFSALRAMVDAGELASATLIAVAGDGAPPTVAAAADLTVDSPRQLGLLLAALADAAGLPAGSDHPDAPTTPAPTPTRGAAH